MAAEYHHAQVSQPRLQVRLVGMAVFCSHGVLLYKCSPGVDKELDLTRMVRKEWTSRQV